MEFWNERFSQPGFAYGAEPNDFLVVHAQRIPPGRVLCLAEGEGRNAVFLAKLGYHVHAVDLSSVGLAKAEALAAQHGVSITTEVADLRRLDLGHQAWQGIVSIWAHMPSAARADLHRRVVEALAPKGVFILEAYTPRQHQTCEPRPVHPRCGRASAVCWPQARSGRLTNDGRRDML